MIKIENKSPEEIAEIGREIGKAFAAEKDGIVKLLTEEQTIKAFEIMTECFYRMGKKHGTPFAATELGRIDKYGELS